MTSLESIEKLRKWSRLGPMVCKDLLDIADEIEGEIAEMQASWAQEAREHADDSARLAELAHENAELKREIAEKYIELPVDADGVPIRLGDVMDGVDKYDTLRDVTGEVIEVSFNSTDSNGCVASVALQVWSEDGKSWHRAYMDQYAGVYRHHVKPRTVEDVLRNFANDYIEWLHYSGAVGEAPSNPVERYADELRELLGGDGR